MLERALMAEASTWDFDWTPPGFRSIDRDDVRAWCYDGGWAGSRGVGRARWTDAQVDGGVAEIRRFFEDCGLPVRWYVGPSTTSRALVDLLAARADARHEPRLMSGDLDAVRFRANPDVEIREITTAAQVREMIQTAFPEFSPSRGEKAVAERVAYLGSPRRGGDYLAYVDGELVGFGNWRDASDRRCVQLVGGWTKPSHRGRGIYYEVAERRCGSSEHYSTLTAFRCARARERGLGLAVIVADPTTSGPIVAKAGFVDHGPLHIYVDVRL